MINAKRIFFILLCIIISSVAVETDEYYLYISCGSIDPDWPDAIDVVLYDSQQNQIDSKPVFSNMNTQEVLEAVMAGHNLDDYKWKLIRGERTIEILDRNYDLSVIDDLNRYRWSCNDYFIATTYDSKLIPPVSWHAPVPAPVTATVTAPKNAATVTIQSPEYNNYDVTVDGEMIGTEGEGLDPLDGIFTFNVAGNKNHMIRVDHPQNWMKLEQFFGAGKSYTFRFPRY